MRTTSPSGLADAWMLLLAMLLSGSALAAQAAASAEPVVHQERVPDGGIQPQLLRGADGTLHLVYFKGDPAAGDLFYCRRGPKEPRFGAAIRVNSEPASAIAVGTIRGAQIALGTGDCLHVVWNGSAKSKPRGPKGETPVLYTFLADSGDSFAPQRNVGGKVVNLDGGACIAADKTGHVYVAWHAGESEETRRVWLASSENGGEIFDAPRAIDKDRAGACACCGMYGSVTRNGEIQFVYRAARDKVHRDICLLTSTDGSTWKGRKLDPWEGKTCPMSSAAIEHAPGGDWAAWETGAQVCFARLDEKKKDSPMSPPGDGVGRKHPRLAANAAGQVLLVWTEGTGWQRGGRMAWQLYDGAGKALPTKGDADGIPVWSFAAVAALPNGDFLVLH